MGSVSVICHAQNFVMITWSDIGWEQNKKAHQILISHGKSLVKWTLGISWIYCWKPYIVLMMHLYNTYYTMTGLVVLEQ